MTLLSWRPELNSPRKPGSVPTPPEGFDGEALREWFRALTPEDQRAVIRQQEAIERDERIAARVALRRGLDNTETGS